MNDSASSAPGESLLPDTTTLFTTAHLAVIAIFAILVILGLIWGARLKHRRKQAERTIEASNAESAQMPQSPPASVPGEGRERRAAPRASAEPAPSSAPVPTAPVPTAPPPPPLDQPATDAAPVAVAPIADEPIAAAAPLDAAPQAEAASAPDAGPASDDPADRPVTLLKGLGPKVAARLSELGITRVGQLAVLDDAAAARLDADLGAFSGRMARDRWVEQARFLAAGDVKGFEAMFGRL
ncbi:hypothetical protein [Sphingomonas beigongshangi]|uniref:hypothetical protein n=1 Tax=Sphingomonas beigongshangi TaxID=2782540 RepID=UPI001AED9AE5|nr:hypothetical protein [Sphingomonas beigongshangi]